MMKLLLALGIALAMMASPAAAALTCTADSSSEIELDGQKTVTISCSGFSSETVSVSGTFTQTCLQTSTEAYPATPNKILSQADSSGTVTFQATSMACQSNADDRKVTWRFTPSSGSVADAYTTFTITSPLSITASFTNSSLQTTKSSSITLTLQVSTTASQDIDSININVSGSNSSLGLTDKTITKIAASSGERTQQVSWTITAPSSSGTYSIEAVVTSQNADSDTATATLAVASSTAAGAVVSSSGGGGGGGGGGGTSVVAETQKLTLVANQLGTIPFLDARLDLQSVSIVSSDVANVVISVERRDSAPSSSEAAPSSYNAYAYLTISALNLNDSSIKAADMEFKVNKTWLAANNAKASDIILLRLSGGEWTKLPTGLIREDASFAYYKSTTPGFSVFAIAVEKPQTTTCGNGICESGESCASDCPAASGGEANVPGADSGTGQASTKPPEETSKFVEQVSSYAWVFVIVIAIAIAGLVFEFTRKKKSAF